MTVGNQTGSSKNTVIVRLVDGAEAANGKPNEDSVFSTVGAAVPRIQDRGPTYGSIRVYNSAGTVDSVAYLRLWGGQRDVYPAAPDTPAVDLGKWFPGGPGSDSGKGIINNGAAMGETSADKLRHSEYVVLPSHADRIYAELGAFTGASAEATAGLDLGTLATGALDTTILAVDPGVDGNDITVSLTGDNSAAVKATLGIDAVTDGNLDTIIRAAVAGVAGNDTTIQLIGGGSGVAIAGVRSYLDLGGEVTNLDTVIEAAIAGTDGDDTTIALVADGDGIGSLDESAFPDLVFHFEDAVTTVRDFEVAVENSVHLRVKTAGADGTVLLDDPDDELIATNLANGVDAEDDGELDETGFPIITFTFTEDVTTVQKFEDAVAASVNLDVDTSGTVADLLTAYDVMGSAHNLTGGADSEGVTLVESGTAVAIHFVDGVSTVAQVETAIGTSTLIEVDAAGTGATVLDAATDDFAATPLTGGEDDGAITVELILDRHPDFSTP